MGTNHQLPDKSGRNNLGWIKPRILEPSSVTGTCSFNSYFGGLIFSVVGCPSHYSTHRKGNALLQAEIMNLCKDQNNLSCNSWMVMTRSRLQENMSNEPKTHKWGGEKISQKQTLFLCSLNQFYLIISPYDSYNKANVFLALCFS